MILEYAQLLSTAHRLLDGKQYEGRSVKGTRKAQRWLLPDDRENAIYMASHIKHPSGIWCRQSLDNYLWLYNLWRDLMKEYTHRYGKNHVAEKLIPFLSFAPTNIPLATSSPMPQCMPDEYKVDGDSIQAYHNYYIGAKQSFAVWTNRPIPEWYVSNYKSRGFKAVSEIDKKNQKVRFRMIPVL